MPGDRPPLMVLGENVVVAGYFENGIYRPVTFGEYMQLIWDAVDSQPPAYLKPVDGFYGIRTVTPLVPGLPAFAFPAFLPVVR